MKRFKTPLLILSMFIMSLSMNAQWSKIQSIYGGALANDGAAAFTIGDKGYVCAGSASNYLFRLDAATGGWTSVGTVPQSMGHAFAMAFSVNNKAYIVGGDSGGVPVAAVWEFDPSAKTNQWTRKADFPAGKRDAGVSFTINGAGYVGCGFDGANLYADMWKYDDAKDKWTLQQGSLPNNMALIFASAFVANNKAYIVGGGIPPSTTVETQQVTEFDPATQKWTARSSFPGAARQAAFAFSNGEIGYYGGGQTGYTNVFDDMWQYNASTDKWSEVEKSPLFSPAWSSAFVVGNYAYVGIGAKFQGGGLTGADSFYKYKMPHSQAGIEMVSEVNQWSVYPNPATNILNIAGTVKPMASISIYNTTGQLILTSQNSQNIDISALADGLYTLQIRSNDQVTTEKFIKKQ